MNAVTPILAAHPVADVETPLWTGRPAWRAAAVHIWKAPWAAAYFALLLADGARLALTAPRGAATLWSGELHLAVVAAGVVGGLLALAALTVRTTRYSIEARTITLRYGLALPARLVIPLPAVEQLDVRVHADGTGDVALRLKPGQRVIYPKLWPHARPWRLRRPEPMLRCIPDAGLAAALICRHLGASR